MDDVYLSGPSSHVDADGMPRVGASSSSPALTEIAHVPVTPTFAIEPHYHDCDEFWLLIEGDGEASMDNRGLSVHGEHRRAEPHGRDPSAVSRQGSRRDRLRGSSVRNGLGISISGRWSP
jgi:hypothetical protein